MPVAAGGAEAPTRRPCSTRAGGYPDDRVSGRSAECAIAMTDADAVGEQALCRRGKEDGAVFRRAFVMSHFQAFWHMQKGEPGPFGAP